MGVPFTRQLGARPGVQLNPILDDSERFVGGNADQIVGITGRFARGRIDRAFRVERSKMVRLLGKSASTKVSALNECYIQLYESFASGTYEAVVFRLTTEDAVLNWAVCKSDTVPANVWATAATPAAGYAFALKHMECFNEGVTFEVNAVEKLDTDGTTQIATKEVQIRMLDMDGDTLYEFAGSLDPAAVDEFGQSRYLPDVAAFVTGENVEVQVATGATILPTATFYGKDVNGDDKWESKALVYFTEGGTGYTNADYDRAMSALKYNDFSFGYLMSGGTLAVALLTRLFALGKDINKQVVWDIPGSYTPDQVITFRDQLNVDSHYAQSYWAPLLTDDPLNGGRAYIGTSGMNVGFRCLRNARTDANGIPPKNIAVAGKDFPITRTSVRQTYNPTENELDDLAKAQINPVLFVRYNTGGRYVFTDSLTCAKTFADRKLIAVADMSSQIDDWVTAYAQECLQMPMKAAVKRMTDFLQDLFEAVEAANWLVPSKHLGDRSFVATVKPNEQRPTDRMDVAYWLSYDGTVRAIYVQQTIAKK